MFWSVLEFYKGKTELSFVRVIAFINNRRLAL